MNQEKYLKLEADLLALVNSSPGHLAISFYDPEKDYSLEIAAEEAFPAASLIKNGILASFFAKVEEGKIDPAELITLSPELICGGDGIIKEFRSGHQLSLDELATLMIIVSDNAATNLIIDQVGMDEVNRYVSQVLGLKGTELQRRLMDLQAAKEGRDNITTAHDQSLFFKQLLAGEIISKTASAKMLDIYRRQQVSGRLDLYLPMENPIAHKHGDLDYLEHDSGIIWKDERPFILSVLTEKNPSNKEGREVIGRVAELVYEAF
ncbi:MAG: serine hydrolase [Eubacteriales bacterium]|nr:serine hydrolase [Eubacteriales bacterium]